MKPGIAPKPNNTLYETPAPIHHDFYRHTYLSWGRLQQPYQQQNINASEVVNPTSTIETIPTSRSVTKQTDRTISEETKRLIGCIALTGIVSALAIGGIVLAVIGFINSAQEKLPPGTIQMYSGNASTLMSSDNQWLYCDGSAVSRTTYRDLFQAIGTTFGSGNGVDTFNVPDLRARFPLGSNTSSDTSFPSGGAATHSITVSELPSHNHDQGTLVTSTTGLHSHTVSDPGHNHGGQTGSAAFSSGSMSMWGFGGSGSDIGSHTHSIPSGVTGVSIVSNGNHVHSITGFTGAQGLGQAMNLMPPYQTVHFMIKT